METSSPKFVNNGCRISFVLKEWTQLRDLLSILKWGCTALVAICVSYSKIVSSDKRFQSTIWLSCFHNEKVTHHPRQFTSITPWANVSPEPSVSCFPRSIHDSMC